MAPSCLNERPVISSAPLFKVVVDCTSTAAGVGLTLLSMATLADRMIANGMAESVITASLLNEVQALRADAQALCGADQMAIHLILG